MQTGSPPLKRRQHKRFKVDGGTVGVAKYQFIKMGQINDISKGGLSFTYFDSGDSHDQIPSESELLKDIVNLPETWLSARLRKVAAREAIDMILAVKQRWKNKPSRIKMPLHRGKRMCVSSTIAELQPSKNSTFDAWLHLASIGNKTVLDIPIKYHRQFNKWNIIPITSVG